MTKWTANKREIQLKSHVKSTLTGIPHTQIQMIKIHHYEEESNPLPIFDSIRKNKFSIVHNGIINTYLLIRTIHLIGKSVLKPFNRTKSSYTLIT